VSAIYTGLSIFIYSKPQESRVESLNKLDYGLNKSNILYFGYNMINEDFQADYANN